MTQLLVVVNFVFPHHVAVPVDFLQAAGHAAEGDRVFVAQAAEQVAVGQQFRVETGATGGLPFVDNIAFHVQEVGGGAHHGRDQRVAVQGFSLVVHQNSGRHGHDFHCAGGLGMCQYTCSDEQGCGQGGGNESVHEIILVKGYGVVFHDCTSVMAFTGGSSFLRNGPGLEHEQKARDPVKGLMETVLEAFYFLSLLSRAGATGPSTPAFSSSSQFGVPAGMRVCLMERSLPLSSGESAA